jgi:hypothetical protein
MSGNPKKKILIACRVMEPEIETLRRGAGDPEVHYLDQGLHRTPQRMLGVVQEKIDSVEAHATDLVLGYGLCSKGIVGVKCRQARLVVPRCHDCITLFLGSRDVYRQRMKKQPGTYYLTPGWIREKKDPLGIVEVEYSPKLGRELAVWGMREELKNYSHITFVDTGTGQSGPLRRRARENAVFFNKIFEGIQGHPGFLERLMHGPYQEPDFVVVDPGDAIRMDMFFN